MDTLSNDSDFLRLTIFICVLISLMSLEHLFPAFNRTQQRKTRWTANFSLSLLSAILLKIILPITAIEFAAITSNKGWGLLPLLGFNSFTNTILSIALLDLAIYWQHVAFHTSSFLWKIHQAHHSDPDIDTSTALRFHPFEIAVSLLFKLICIAAIGASPAAVLTFEILLNSFAMFNHSNIKLPSKVEFILQKFIITPNMHRTHHSTEERETNSNYGFSTSIWDRLFGTALTLSQHEQNKLLTGLKDHLSAQTDSLFWALKLPFLKTPNAEGRPYNETTRN